jgi:hypothetical protein
MAELSGFARTCLNRQGFVDLEDSAKARLNLSLRFTPTLCFSVAAVGIALQSAILLGILAASALGAAAGIPHVFDVLYNRVIRPLGSGPALPPNPPPRRFAFVMATPVIAAASVAFALGATGLGLAFGLLQLAGCLVYITTGWCPGSFAHEKLFGPMERPGRVGEVSGDHG